LLFLADLRSGESLIGWPSLLELAGADAQARQDLMSLWRLAFSEAITGANAWPQMLDWLLLAETVPGLDDVAARFFDETLRDTPLLARARFHFVTWRRRHPGVGILRRILP
jgi:hypothetical protein